MPRCIAPLRQSGEAHTGFQGGRKHRKINWIARGRTDNAEQVSSGVTAQPTPWLRVAACCAAPGPLWRLQPNSRPGMVAGHARHGCGRKQSKNNTDCRDFDTDYTESLRSSRRFGHRASRRILAGRPGPPPGWGRAGASRWVRIRAIRVKIRVIRVTLTFREHAPGAEPSFRMVRCATPLAPNGGGHVLTRHRRGRVEQLPSGLVPLRRWRRPSSDYVRLEAPPTH